MRVGVVKFTIEFEMDIRFDDERYSGYSEIKDAIRLINRFNKASQDTGYEMYVEAAAEKEAQWMIDDPENILNAIEKRPGSFNVVKFECRT